MPIYFSLLELNGQKKQIKAWLRLFIEVHFIPTSLILKSFEKNSSAFLTTFIHSTFTHL